MTHYIVADLGYGDAGKGTVVDWLCSHGGAEPVHTVVRFNGGAQAAHNVVAPDGRHHTFAQFGSGTFTPGVRTHLSRFMLVDPAALAAEAAHLGSLGIRDALDRLTVDRDALLTTPYHRAANQARERARGDAKFDKVLAALPLLENRPDAADWLRRLREAALLDEEGKALDGALKTVATL